MDMSVVAVDPHPSLALRIITLFLVLYPIVLLLYNVGGRRQHTLASVIVPIVLTPLFVGMCGVLLIVAHVFEGASLSGGGRASQSAGVAEALLALVIATVSAGVASAIALVLELTRRQEVVRENAQVRAQIMAIVAMLALLGWTALLANKAASSAISLFDYRVAVTSALIALCAALGTCVWLIVVRRRDIGLQARFPIGASLTGLAVSALIGAVTWQFVEHFRAIAIGR